MSIKNVPNGSIMMAEAFRARGTMPTATPEVADALLGRVETLRGEGRTLLAAELERQYGAALDGARARRAEPIAPSNAVTPHLHLDQYDQMVAQGRTRQAATYYESFATPIEQQRAARAAETAARTAPAPAAAPVARQAAPRRFLDELERLQASGMTRAAMTFAEANAPLIAHERAQRDAELAGAPPPPKTLQEILSAGTATQAAPINQFDALLKRA